MGAAISVSELLEHAHCRRDSGVIPHPQSCEPCDHTFTVRDHCTFRAAYMEAIVPLLILGSWPRCTALKTILWHDPDRATRIFAESGQ